jgi:hypothetical protein
MGYFDRQGAALFRKDAQGRDLFFIWGNLGRGRVVPTEADGVAVRRYLKYHSICMIVGIVLMVMLAGEPLEPRWYLTIGIFIALALAAFLPLVIRTEQWEIADERLTYREAMAARGTGSLWFLAVLSWLFVAGGLILLLATDAMWMGLVCILFFGACLGIFVWLLIVRRRG